MILEKVIPDEDIKMSTNITQLCEQKRGRGDNDSDFFMAEIYDSLLGWVCLSSAADRGSALGQERSLFICSLGKGLKST